MNWMDDAACAGMELDEFFPAQGAGPTAEAFAVLVCKLCPVRLSCLEYALETRAYGIWWATNEEQRKAMIRQGQRAKRRAGVAAQ